MALVDMVRENKVVTFDADLDLLPGHRWIPLSRGVVRASPTDDQEY